jgi:hypothetical protein
MVLVGISKLNPHLHAFSTPEKPHSPLLLTSWEWKAILDAHDGVLHAKFRSFECQAEASAVKLIEEVDR